TETRSEHSSFVLGRSLYIAGGRNGTGMLSSLETADFDATGTLGAFAVMPSAFATARSQHTSNVIGDYVYVVGGFGNWGSNTYGTVERAQRK
ncbi:MAG TPA: hypothetical protein VIA18_30680, partial [Polyangia bacterium]|nr:hypothetical protein [Polyangia bacterium]